MKRNFLNDSINLRDAEGFVCGAVSGALTTVAAGGDVFAFVNLIARPVAILAVRTRFVTTTAFGSAQSLAFRINKVTGFSAQHDTGGTSVQAHYLNAAGGAINQAGAAVVSTDRIPTTEMNGYIGGTGAISGGTYTAEDTDEPDHLVVSASATMPIVQDDWIVGRDLLPLVLNQNEGLVVNCNITMGASGVGNLFVGLEGWRP